jgi:hypothetical protein
MALTLAGLMANSLLLVVAADYHEVELAFCLLAGA